MKSEDLAVIASRIYEDTRDQLAAFMAWPDGISMDHINEIADEVKACLIKEVKARAPHL